MTVIIRFLAINPAAMMEACNTQTCSPAEKNKAFVARSSIGQMQGSVPVVCWTVHMKWVHMPLIWILWNPHVFQFSEKTLSSGGTLVSHEHFLCVYAKNTKQNKLFFQNKLNSCYEIKKLIGPGVCSMSNSKQWAEFPCLQRCETQNVSPPRSCFDSCFQQGSNIIPCLV